MTYFQARQREEYTQCTNMMLKLRDQKIQRLESLVDGLIPADSYLLDENSALSAEIKLLQAKVDKNPEVTRFAMEYDRVLEQVRKWVFVKEKKSLKQYFLYFLLTCSLKLTGIKIFTKKEKERCC